MTPDQILDGLARRGEFPAAEIRYSLEHPETVVPVFLQILESAAEGRELDETHRAAMLVIVHILGDLREKRAYRPLMKLLHHDDPTLEAVLGDSLTETVPQIVISVFDGDPEPLHALIEDPNADQFARALGFKAWTHWAATGGLSRDEAREQLLRWWDLLRAEEDDYSWIGWIEAIAALGLDDLVDTVKTAYEQGPLVDSFMHFSEFEEDLRAAKEDRDRFFRQSRIVPFSGIIVELADWYCFSPEYDPEADALADEEFERLLKMDHIDALIEMYGEDALAEAIHDVPQGPLPAAALPPQPGAPAHNPVRHVGRNDPCPCGSGKKFKKCCMR